MNLSPPCKDSYPYPYPSDQSVKLIIRNAAFVHVTFGSIIRIRRMPYSEVLRADLSAKGALAGSRLFSRSTRRQTIDLSIHAAGTQTLKSGTQKLGPRTGGTRKVTAIEIFSKEKKFRAKQTVVKPQPKILSRVQELRLLSKLEEAGLLSLLEKNGVTLTAIEKSGILTTAENLGLISAAADRNTPSALFTLSTALLVLGPALVYFLPDDSAALIAVQVLGATVCAAGGAAAYGGASLLSSLQK